MGLMNKAEYISNLWNDYIEEVSSELFNEFVKTYKFWSSLFSIALEHEENVFGYSKVPRLNIDIADMREQGTFYFTNDGRWSYSSGKMNTDYQETILYVLNGIIQEENKKEREEQ